MSDVTPSVWTQDQATDVMASCVKATWAINEIMKICETLADPASRRTVRTATGEIAGLIFTDLMLPIIDTYPELKPSYLTDC